jgi:hypothetical protein
MVFIFDLGTTGDGSTDYYFDEITQPGSSTLKPVVIQVQPASFRF